MRFPPLPVSGSLLQTLVDLIPPPEKGPILILGNNKKIINALISKGYIISQNEKSHNEFNCLICIHVLPKKIDEAHKWIWEKGKLLNSDGYLFVCEQSSPKTGNRGLISKIMTLLGFIHPPGQLTSLFLRSGYKNINQIWPQGIRSIVLTWGIPGFYSHNFPIEK
jgi:hypothetical protein